MNDRSSNHTTSYVKNEVLVISITTRELRDVEVSRALRDEIAKTASAFHGNRVVVDLGSVEFIGSIGLLGLLGLRRQLSQNQGRMAVCNLRPTVRDMFVACRLINPNEPRSAPFETENTVEDALSLLAT